MGGKENEVSYELLMTQREVTGKAFSRVLGPSMTARGVSKGEPNLVH